MSNYIASMVNLAEPRLGAEVVEASDDFFAPKERLIDPAEPVFIPGKYDDHGKWMDGWESRRRREGGHDYCVVRLGQPGMVQAVEIDTRYFTGNYPPGASLEGCASTQRVPDSETQWDEIVPKLSLQGDDRHLVNFDPCGPWTHLRLNIFPDGGVARLRVFGHFRRNRAQIQAGPGADDLMDLAAIENGGCALACNNEHYGRLANVLAPGPGVNMGDGWETRRRRDPGHDWGIIRLAGAGLVEKILLNTAFFKGNFPHRCSLQASHEQEQSLDELVAGSADWPQLLPEQLLAADTDHHFGDEILAHEPIRFVRINLIPDGGISRIRLFGRLAPESNQGR